MNIIHIIYYIYIYIYIYTGVCMNLIYIMCKIHIYICVYILCRYMSACVYTYKNFVFIKILFINYVPDLRKQ